MTGTEHHHALGDGHGPDGAPNGTSHALQAGLTDGEDGAWPFSTPTAANAMKVLPAAVLLGMGADWMRALASMSNGFSRTSFSSQV